MRLCFIYILGMQLACAAETWTLNLQQMPLRYLLQSMADIQGQNIAIGQNVQGKLDLHLEQVSFQQLWDFLLTTQHLMTQNQGGILWVDKSYSYSATQSDRKNVYPQMKSFSKQFHYLEVEKIRELIQDKQHALVSPLAKVMLDESSNTIWISDILENIQILEDFLQQLDKPIEQIEIQARIVHINSQYAKDLGVRLGLQGQGLLSNQIHPESTNQSNLVLNLAAQAINATPMTLAMSVAKLGQQYVDAELSALESKGQARIIASPRLVTSNQQESSIASGDDIPYQESSLNGATSVSFKKALLKLKVKPYLLYNQTLILNIELNQDADSGRRVQGVPVISTKSMRTQVRLRSGQTIVLGGIYKEEEQGEKTGLPLIKDLPLIGDLFSRKQDRHLHDELLIFITPSVLHT